MPTDSGSATYLEAVGLALDSEMDRDPDVFIIGEDVGQFGGAFKVTKGFLDKFGPRRVVDTPIAETGFTGLAAGAALVGLRPVVEFQFADFISCAFDPIINVLARHHWRTGDPMPVTMRAPFGGRLRAGPTHSQSVESYFAHVPGLKIVMPGTPEDAAGLLISSIRDNNPTLYLENKYLYRRLKASGPLSLDPIRRAGSGPATSASSPTRPGCTRPWRWPRSWTRTASRSRSSTSARWCRSTSRRSSTR
jgi:2-oxoisovalerate dehydrogenase E1 component beta subunit